MNSLSQMAQQRGKWGFWNAEGKTRPCNCWSWYSCLDCWIVHLTYAATHYFPARQRPPRVSYICQMLCCSFSTSNMGDCVKKDTARTCLQRCCRFTQYCTMGEMWTHYKYTQGPRSHLPHLSHLSSLILPQSPVSLGSSRFVQCVKETKQTQAHPFGDASLQQAKQWNSLKPFQSSSELKIKPYNCKVLALISCSLYWIL